MGSDSDFSPDWEATLLERMVSQRDPVEKHFETVYNAYNILANRALSGEKDKILGLSPQDELSIAYQSHTKTKDKVNSLESKLKDALKEIENAKLQQKELEDKKRKIERRLKDFKDEMTEKDRSLQRLQDDLLEYQILTNVTEERFNILKKENKQLIERLLIYKAKEAETMNNAMNK